MVRIEVVVNEILYILHIEKLVSSFKCVELKLFGFNISVSIQS